MKKALMSSVLFGVLAAGSAGAADLRMPTKAPILKAPPAPVYNWTGCYLGGGAGYGFLDDQRDSEVGGVVVVAQHDIGGRGWFGTVQGGCDIQFNSFLPFLSNSMVFGAFADGDWGSIKGTDAVGPFAGEEKLDNSWAVGARLGWLPTDRFLTFVSGGFTQAHIEDINFTAAFAPGVSFTLPADRQDGWFIGAGYEYNLGWLPGLTWKTEYRYADYGSRTDTVLVNPPVGGPPLISNSHLFVQTIRSELVWRFNWAGAPVMSRY